MTVFLQDNSAQRWVWGGALCLLAVAAWSFYQPKDMGVWWLEAAPVIVVAPLLWFTRRRFPLTPMLYVLIWLHAVILLIGAHYTYAEVPLFNWIRDTYGFSRNNYDKIGHFAQGFVPAMVARELLLRTSPIKPGKWLMTIITLSCLGISAIYELIEWAAAVLSSEGADAFLGAQGDVWDSQSDMFLAGVGAVAALALLSKWHDFQLKKLP